jgi:hypothetical protein
MQRSKAAVVVVVPKMTRQLFALLATFRHAKPCRVVSASWCINSRCNHAAVVVVVADPSNHPPLLLFATKHIFYSNPPPPAVYIIFFQPPHSLSELNVILLLSRVRETRILLLSVYLCDEDDGQKRTRNHGSSRIVG